MYQNALNDLKDQGYSDSTRGGDQSNRENDFPKGTRVGANQKGSY
jgi:hypothetical protein